MELLVNLVVFRLSPRGQIEVRLVVAVVSQRAVHPPFTLLLAQGLETARNVTGLVILSGTELLLCYIIKTINLP